MTSFIKTFPINNFNSEKLRKAIRMSGNNRNNGLN